MLTHDPDLRRETFDGKVFSLRNAIGVPFGSKFFVSGDQIHPTKHESIIVCYPVNLNLIYYRI